MPLYVTRYPMGSRSSFAEALAAVERRPRYKSKLQIFCDEIRLDLP
jgi:hypothetical protein